MSKPIFITVRKRHKADCAIAALACLLQRPYEEVLVVVARVVRHALVRGLTNTNMIKVAARFNITLVRRVGTEIDYSTMTGILGAHLRHNNAGDEHAVVLSHGLIYDPEDGEVWKVRDYLKQFNATHIDLLSLED